MLAVQTGRNVVHGSDSPENGERETGDALHSVHISLPFYPVHASYLPDEHNKGAVVPYLVLVHM